MSLQPITISYQALLKEDLSPLHDAIERAFGSSEEALGLIILKDLPEQFAQLREDALRASAAFASLPEDVREKYSDTSSGYSFGWSHGKEVMNGVPDVYKGSYYANPSLDQPTAPDAQKKDFPMYLGNNIWPSSDDCPGFEAAFKSLASFMQETGKRLAKACDHLVAQHSKTASIEKMISSSQCSKARLLHYFPPKNQIINLDETSPAKPGENGSAKDSWCGDHLDHSLLTALCPSMYLFHPSGQPTLQPLAVPAPTASAGLYIRTRAGKEVKAVIPSDCMAFQTGEALELLTEGRLKATPHYVAAGQEGPILQTVLVQIGRKVQEGQGWEGVKSGVISRETMAVFLQPDVDADLGKETFGQFSRRTWETHYEK